MKELVKALLEKDPKLRLTSIESIKNDKFYSDFSFEKLLNKEIVAPYIPSVVNT